MRRLITPIVLGLFVASAVTFGACRDDKMDDDGEGGETGEGGTGGEMRTPRPLTVVNWNVHNLIDNTDDGEQFEDQDPDWQQHVSQVAGVLDSIDADVIMLQEVEHEDILGAVVDELDSAYVFHQVIDANDPRGIDNGVISKIQPDDVISHASELFSKDGTNQPQYRYSRDALEVRITFNGRRIVFLNVHYKSKENDDADKRLAEAQHTREIANAITAEDAATAVIILGDFNDLPGSAAVDWTIGGDPDTYGNAPNFVDSADRWTFDFQGTLELVDHQIASPLIFDMLDESSVEILHTPQVEAASDHAPIVATYNVF